MKHVRGKVWNVKVVYGEGGGGMKDMIRREKRKSFVISDVTRVLFMAIFLDLLLLQAENDLSATAPLSSHKGLKRKAIDKLTIQLCLIIFLFFFNKVFFLLFIFASMFVSWYCFFFSIKLEFSSFPDFRRLSMM